MGDACETSSNPNDPDGDGIDSANDICPNVYNPNQDPTDNNSNNIPDECETGGPGPSSGDLDGDGVNDDVDNCPTVANVSQTDTDSDGVGDSCQFSGASDTMDNILLTGIAFTDSHSQYDPTLQMDVQYYSYESISWDSTNGTSDTVTDWDATNKTFVSGTMGNGLLLQTVGWTQVSEAVSLTVPGDGTATASRGDGSGWSVTLTGEVMDMAGQPMGMFLDYDWAMGVDLAGTFTTGAQAIRLSIDQTVDSYEIRCDGPTNPDTSDNCNTAYDQNHTSPLTTLDSLLSATANQSNLQTGGYGKNMDFAVEFVGNAGDTSGTANYYGKDTMGNPMSLGTGTWAIATVRNAQVLTHTPPVAIQYEGLRYFAVYNGYVREVEFNAAGQQQHVAHNANAMGQIAAVFNPSTPGGSGTDTDSDGYADSVDNCPTVYNPDQADTNSNGVGDACESGGQPLNLSMFQVKDTDGDGTPDMLDAFPTDNTEAVDTDGDGTGNNADTDDDGDGIADVSDNCPLIADASNSSTACNNGAIIGGHKLDMAYTLTVTTEPQTGFCFGNEPTTGTDMQVMAMSDGGDGTVIVNAETRLVFNSDTGVLSGTWTRQEQGKLDTSGNPVSVTNAVNLTFNSGTSAWTGTHSETWTGSNVDCVRSETITGQRIYQPTGSENYNGVFALELASEDKQTGNMMQDSHTAQMEFDGIAGTVAFYDADGYRNVLDSYYDRYSGGFWYVDYVEHMEDTDHDGAVDDLVQDVLRIDGVLVAASTTVPEMWFRAKSTRLVYANTSSYSNQDADFGENDFDGKGYGRRLVTEGYHLAQTSPASGGGVQQQDFIGLHNPPLKHSQSGSSLSLEVYAGTGTGGALLCSDTYQNRYTYQAIMPDPDMSTGALRVRADTGGDAPYGTMNCAVAAGTVVQGSTYTMVIRDTVDNSILWSDSNGTYTAVATNAYPSTIPDRTLISFNGATVSSTETGSAIPVSGYFNPMADTSVNWPAETNALAYQLRLYEYDSMNGADNKETRVVSQTNSALIPAGAIRRLTMARLRARIDDGTAMGVVSYSQSRNVLLAPGLNGMVNVEMLESGVGPTIFQMAVHTDDHGLVYCSFTQSGSDNCSTQTTPSGEMANGYIDYAANTVTIYTTSGNLTLVFSNAVDASADLGAATGNAIVVTSELVAKTRVRPNGVQSTQLYLTNPTPDYAMGTIVDAATSGSTFSTTLWDNNTSGSEYGAKVGQFVASDWDGVPATNGTSASYETSTSATALLANGGYVATLSGNTAGFADRTFKASYTAADPASMDPPLRSVVVVSNATTGAGTGGNPWILSSADLPSIDWTSAAPANAEWQVIIRGVDGANAEIPGQDIRTSWMDTSHAGLSLNGTTWTWTNPDAIPVDVWGNGKTKIILRVRPAGDGDIQGVSDAFFVTP